jgi:hypothetical protein
VHQCLQQWNEFDDKAAVAVTEFKQKYVLEMVGGIPARTVAMALSTCLTFSALGQWNKQLIQRTRNLAVHFVVNGLFWVP